MADTLEPLQHDTETTAMAYQESVASVQTLASWYEALDTKIVAVFSVSSVIAVLAPKVADAPKVIWILALAAWGIAAIACFVAFNTRRYTLDPNPNVLINDKWLELSPDEFREHRLKRVVQTYGENRKAYNKKDFALKLAMYATGAEVLCLVIAMLGLFAG
jgi:hypothetical protein